MKVGFTGSRYGPTAYQAWKFLKVISELEIDEFHHGDCMGADCYAHITIRRQYQSCKIVIHLLANDKLNAFCQADEYHEPRQDLTERDRAIVDETDLLIAMLGQETESCTWSNVRYAREQDKPVIVIYSDGMIENSMNVQDQSGLLFQSCYSRKGYFKHYEAANILESMGFTIFRHTTPGLYFSFHYQHWEMWRYAFVRGEFAYIAWVAAKRADGQLCNHRYFVIDQDEGVTIERMVRYVIAESREGQNV